MLQRRRRKPSTIDRGPKKTVVFWVFMGVAVILAGLMFWTIESREAPASAAAIYEPARPDPIAPPMSPPTLAQVLDSPDPAFVLVIGDSTGFADYQWVTRFANRIGLAYDRPVNVARWNEGTIAYDPPIAVAQGRGAPVTVWNASAPGESPRYSQTHLKAMTAPVREPALIIINHGHNTGPDPATDISRLVKSVRTQYRMVPIGLTVQNPYLGQSPENAAQRAHAVRDWAARQRNTVVIDVHSAYTASPDIASLYQDQRHPNATGGDVWAATIWSTFELR